MDIVLGMRNGAARFVTVDDANIAAFANGTQVVNDGQWHHIAGVRNTSAGLVQLYVDGVLDTSVTDTTGSYVEVSAVPWNIGNTPGSGPSFSPWNGLIDEVEIFNVALSASEIQSIFNAGSAGKCKPGATPIPSLSLWALIGMALLLGGLFYFVLARRSLRAAV